MASLGQAQARHSGCLGKKEGDFYVLHLYA